MGGGKREFKYIYVTRERERERYGGGGVISIYLRQKSSSQFNIKSED